MSTSLYLAHITDLHFKPSDRGLIKRSESLALAIASRCLKPTSSLMIAVTGDIAYSGSKDEYLVATEFFIQLLDRLKQELPTFDIQLCLVPGNHDCNLAKDQFVRTAVIEQLGSKSPSGDAFKHLREVQSDFYDFCDLIASSGTPCQQTDPFRFTLDNSGRSIGFTLINTAITCQRQDPKGCLYFPYIALHSEQINTHLEIGLAHHSPHWFTYEDQRRFQDFLSSRFDLVLYGHEHDADSYRIERHDNSVLYARGKALFDPTGQPGGFSLLEVDLDGMSLTQNLFEWKESSRLYSLNEETIPLTIRRNNAIQQLLHEPSQVFSNWLKELGIEFRKSGRQINLADVFVCPDLVQRSDQRTFQGKKETEGSVKSNDFDDFLLKTTKLIINGQDKSGKTSLAKHCFQVLRKRKGITPLYIDASKLEKSYAFSKLINDKYRDQFSSSQIEAFNQLGRLKRALIIDNLSEASLKPAAMVQFIQECEHFAEHIVILSDPSLQLNTISSKSIISPLLDYNIYYIKEYSRLLRSKMIAKWISLGECITESDESFYREVSQKEVTLDTVLGKQLVPCFPIFILSILHTSESASNKIMANGSYGELYEALITDQFLRVATNSTDIGTLYKITSHIAFDMHCSRVTYSSREYAYHKIALYAARYGLLLDSKIVLNQLIQANIFERHSDTIQFKYDYLYYYFIARYFADEPSTRTQASELNTKLNQIAGNFFSEESQNIIIFYLYRTKDESLLERIIEMSHNIFSDAMPVKLSDDIDSLNSLYRTGPKPLTVSENITRNRAGEMKMKDEIEESARVISNTKDEVIYSDELDDHTKLTIGIRTVQVLGQVLRNFPGVLEQQLKVKVAESCYLLGFRMLSFIFKEITNNLVEYRQMYITLLKQYGRSPAPSEELSNRADEAIVSLCEFWAFGIIRMLTHVTGHHELTLTYRDVFARNEDLLSFRLLDISIRLDHGQERPQQQIDYELGDGRINKNIFGFRLLRSLIAFHFRLFKVPTQFKQKYSEAFEMKLVGNDTKDRHRLDTK